MSEEFEMTAETTEYDDDDTFDEVDEGVDTLDDEDNGSADAVDGEASTDNDAEGDHKAEEVETTEDKPEEEVKKPKGEKSSEQAEARRQREREKIRYEAIKEAVGVNPYTGEKISDGTDVEEYLVMKRIADRGGDPIAEYAKEIKSSIRAMNKNIDAQLREDSERNEHLASYPEDAELLETVQFKRFADKLKGVSLANIVEAYKLADTSAEQIKKEAAKVAAQATANRKASPGSVKGAAETVSANEGLYTLEQLKKMSPDELDKNWEKVEKSYAKLQKRK